MNWRQCFVSLPEPINTLRPRQNGRHFADDTLKHIFVNENARLSIKISLKFVPLCQINNISVLVRIMAWRRPGDKPLSEPMMVSLLTHICVNRPQWVLKVIKLIDTTPLILLRYANPAGLINTLRPRQKGHHFPDDIFKWVFFNENEFRLTFHWSLFLGGN